MSDEDRERWNQRYRDGAYAGRDHPADWLVHCLERLGTGAATGMTGRPTAVDLACGAGRNALYLAAQGHEVYAVDIADEALRRGREQDSTRIRFVEWDLDRGLPAELPAADLILMIRYLDLDLIPSVTRQLKTGGHLLADVHLQSDREVAGPRNPDFRAAPGALRMALVEAGLNVVEYREEHTDDPDGRPVAVARALARKG